MMLLAGPNAGYELGDVIHEINLLPGRRLRLTGRHSARYAQDGGKNLSGGGTKNLERRLIAVFGSFHDSGLLGVGGFCSYPTKRS
jgi:hypothetical protein